MYNPLKNLIEVIKTGAPTEVKSAQKEVKKFWHKVYIPQREKGRQCFGIFLDELKNFEQIKDIDHQAYFINTLKWPIWSIGEEYFEEWAEFILKYIQHPSGKIRQAVVKAADYLIMDIVVDIRSQGEEQRIQRNRERFGNFVYSVERLLEKYDEPRFHRYKYISSMPASVYKSLQKLLIEDLLRSEYYEKIYLEHKYSRQKQRPEEFNMPGLKLVQKEKDNWDYYYDAMEYLGAGNDKEAEALLKKAIKADKDFVAGHLGMVSLYKSRRNNKKVKEYTNLAFEKTKRKFPKWPKEMPWGVLENRQYLRAICGKAILHHENKEKKEAEELYRLLLKLNPNDNQGVRYLLAALYAGKHPKIVDELIDKGNRLQNWDELKKFLEEQNRKHKFWESKN